MQTVFIALDFTDKQRAWDFLEQFPAEERPAVKIGMELFYREGPEFVKAVKDAGFTVFLDLKLYDIPNTVEHAVANLARLDLDYLTVHTAGGVEMMQAAVRGAEQGAQAVGATAPKLLGITQLTSFSEATMQATQLVQATMAESVTHLAKLADEAGLAGTISSAFESEMIHNATRDGFLSITPGIRLQGDAVGDQSRVVTPARARQMTADGIVVGRSITQAAEPVQAYRQVVQEFTQGA
ncbi:orotidine-5'-phosphate decarboxylase [Weissella uvarum]|uniref:orotidine-5'-phosphate decarboxylase n=1 Tax=Weissella uvarum TaxID=1479233 RepID=UPI00195F3A8B|nr:orotidine-5'-phosphate decarboxylase [Weissella uvarum]MBM7618019.1 orotidine-5'-phosphate decarboxylase [Weissella uvarum]MCM0596238.1 orotidine-5'-phosphate decarboxylase [Weissella uvarum]